MPPSSQTSTEARKQGRNPSPTRWLQRQVYGTLGRTLSRRLHRSAFAPRATEAQRNMVLTGFILGCISIITALFPICGVPIALAGLLIGMYARNTTPLRALSAWTIALSIAGLLLSFIYIIVTMSIYYGHYISPRH